MTSLTLYLDFDGVLHHDNVWLDLKNRPVLRGPGHLFEHAKLLVEILSPYPEIEIVLSTGWVRVKGFGYSVKKLPIELRQRVVEATWHSNFKLDEELVSWWLNDASRYHQIASDVRRRKPSTWLAIDDDADGWPQHLRDQLIQCDPEIGLGSPDIRRQLETCLANLLA
jgi:hypothetical protein